MAKIECNPECAVCGKQVAPEDKLVILGHTVHFNCEEDLQHVFNNTVDPTPDSNQ